MKTYVLRDGDNDPRIEYMTDAVSNAERIQVMQIRALDSQLKPIPLTDAQKALGLDIQILDTTVGELIELATENDLYLDEVTMDGTTNLYDPS